MADPRMNLNLADCHVPTPASEARRAVRARRDTANTDAAYLGRPAAPAEPRPQTVDEIADEIAKGVVAGMKAKAGGQR